METVTTWSDDYDYSTEYTTDEDYPSDGCNNIDVRLFESAVTPIIFAVVTVLSCVGNVLVLWILIKYEDLRSLTNAFLVNLAVSDLLFTAGLPFWASYHVWGWKFGEVGCRLVSFVFYLGFYSSLIFLTMMTVHRYVAVMHPLSVAMNKRLYYGVVASAIIWFFSVCAATPDIVFKTLVTEGDSRYCDYNEDGHSWKLFGIYQQNAFFVGAFVTIAYCYVRILGRLLRPTSHTRPKTVKLILCIVIVFFVGWIPYNVTIFLETLVTWNVLPGEQCSIIRNLGYVHGVSRLVAFSHCCLNPVFYVFVGIKFRSHLKKMLKNLCRHEEQSQYRHSRFIYSNGEEVSIY